MSRLSVALIPALTLSCSDGGTTGPRVKPVASVEVTPSMDTIEVGETLQLTATPRDVTGQELGGRKVVWSSGNDSVAIVSENGLVTGVAAGTVGITAVSQGKVGGASLKVVVFWASVSAASDHTCGVRKGGRADCWGSGLSGQLGDGSSGPFSKKLVPTLVAGGLTWASVSAGYTHTCGVTTGGKAYCWGDGGFGQLGNGSRERQILPTQVAGGLTWASVSAGGHYTCGVTTGGEAYCWGRGSAGQLGNGSSGSIYEEFLPTLVAGGLTWASVSAGYTHTCGVTMGGNTYCWGSGWHGQLGNGSIEEQLIPTLVASGLTWRSVSAGAGHTCGVTTGGDAYCWGRGQDGQLGNGSTEDRLLPTLVAGGLTWASVATSEESRHTCGVTTGGEAYCWGSGWHGRLGNGSIEAQLLPTLVAGGLTWASVGGGYSHTCGVTTEAEAYCWGLGQDGQLGTGSLEDEYVPRIVRAGW